MRGKAKKKRKKRRKKRKGREEKKGTLWICFLRKNLL